MTRPWCTRPRIQYILTTAPATRIPLGDSVLNWVDYVLEQPSISRINEHIVPPCATCSRVSACKVPGSSSGAASPRCNLASVSSSTGKTWTASGTSCAIFPFQSLHTADCQRRRHHLPCRSTGVNTCIYQCWGSLQRLFSSINVIDC